MRTILIIAKKEILIDEEDLNRLSKFKWSTRGNNYFYRVDKLTANKARISLPSEIMNRPGVMFDHIDLNPLNNQKSNLRECDYSTNAMNTIKRPGTTSKYKGVYWSRRDRRWRMIIRLNGKSIVCKSFVNEIDAAKAYDDAAKQLFKEFARLNFS